MPKIFLYCVPLGSGSGVIRGSSIGGDVMGYALAEDGKGLSSHLSSNEEFSRHDMGLTSDWHHDRYTKHYPEGFELEWIEYEDLDNHAGWVKAFELNKASKE